MSRRAAARRLRWAPMRVTGRRSQRWAPRPPGRRERIKGLVLIGAVAAAIAAFVAFGLVANGDFGRRQASAAPTTTTTLTPAEKAADQRAAQWSKQVDDDFHPLTQILVAYLQTIQSWSAGTVSDSSLEGYLSDEVPTFQQVLDRLDRQPPLAEAPRAIDDYRQAAELYILSTDVLSSATYLPAGPLRQQVALSATRIRDLGDRIFDQGTAALAPFTPVAATPDVTEIEPADVPVWASMDLAPGPPLTSASPPVPPVHYQSNRPQVSFPIWSHLVTSAGIPPVAAEAAAIRGGSLATDSAQSQQLAAAVTKLNADPDPKGDRADSTRLRLGLLVDEEATLAAGESDLAGAGSKAAAGLRQAAMALALVGDDLWDPALGPRSTGFPPSLLTAANPALPPPAN
jgi:hypothetical protein